MLDERSVVAVPGRNNFDDLVRGDPLRPDSDGNIAIPSTPGLGFEWSDEGIEKNTVSAPARLP
eukprot:COSAG04_NODE_1526_length_6459_cov_1.920283_10_plen_63_part_00